MQFKYSETNIYRLERNQIGYALPEKGMHEYITSMDVGHSVRVNKYHTHNTVMQIKPITRENIQDSLGKTLAVIKEALEPIGLKISSYKDAIKKIQQYQNENYLYTSKLDKEELHEVTTQAKKKLAGKRYELCYRVHSRTDVLADKFKTSSIIPFQDTDDVRTVVDKVDVFQTIATAYLETDLTGKVIECHIPDGYLWECAYPRETANSTIHIPTKENKAHTLRQKTKEKIKWNTTSKHGARLTLPVDALNISRYSLVIMQDELLRLCVYERIGHETYKKLFILSESGIGIDSRLAHLEGDELASLIEKLQTVQRFFGRVKPTYKDVYTRLQLGKFNPFHKGINFTKYEIVKRLGVMQGKRPDKRTREALKAQKADIDLRNMTQSKLRKQSLKLKEK